MARQSQTCWRFSGLVDNSGRVLTLDVAYCRSFDLESPEKTWNYCWQTMGEAGGLTWINGKGRTKTGRTKNSIIASPLEPLFPILLHARSVWKLSVVFYDILPIGCVPYGIAGLLVGTKSPALPWRCVPVGLLDCSLGPNRLPCRADASMLLLFQRDVVDETCLLSLARTVTNRLFSPFNGTA